jgi:hypothetical protein
LVIDEQVSQGGGTDGTGGSGCTDTNIVITSPVTLNGERNNSVSTQLTASVSNGRTTVICI